MHQTNYAINKTSKKYVYNEDENEANTGSKRSLDFFWSYIDSHNGNSQLLKLKINQAIVKTLCAVQPQLAQSYSRCQPDDISNSMCFELLGFDIMIDNTLEPWLLEVNHSPSFITDTPFDYKVKRQLIYDTINMLNMDVNNRFNYNAMMKTKIKKKWTHKKESNLKLKSRTDSQDEKCLLAMKFRDEYELKNLGGYTRIYPDSEMDETYNKYIKLSNGQLKDYYDCKREIYMKFNKQTHIRNNSIHLVKLASKTFRSKHKIITNKVSIGTSRKVKTNGETQKVDLIDMEDQSMKYRKGSSILTKSTGKKVVRRKTKFKLHDEDDINLNSEINASVIIKVIPNLKYKKVNLIPKTHKSNASDKVLLFYYYRNDP